MLIKRFFDHISALFPPHKKSRSGKQNRSPVGAVERLEERVVLTVDTFTWDGGGSDTNWMTAENWDTDVIPTEGSNLVFPDGFAGSSSNDFPDNTNFNDITIASAGYSLSGNVIDLDGDLFETATGVSAISFGIELQSGRTVNVVSGGQLALNGNIDDGAASYSLSKTGAGTLTLPTANSYDGGTMVDGGLLEISNYLALGTGAVSINDSSSFALNDDIDVSNPLTLTGLPNAGYNKLLNESGNNTYSGSIAITGPNNESIEVGSGQTLTLTGSLSGSRDLDKNGSGTLDLDGTSTHTGHLNVYDGTLLVNGDYSTSSLIFVDGTLGGTGTVSAVEISNIGTLAPGNSPGILHTGDLTFSSSGSIYSVQINGTTVGSDYDQTDATGSITLADATLSISLGFLPDVGDTFEIINNEGSGAVNGTFNGLPEGATFTIGNQPFEITYVGGDSNDVYLTALMRVDVWTGNGGDSNWTTDTNWLSGVAPLPGDQLVFPSGSADFTTINDFSAGTEFDSIVIASANYSLIGNPILIDHGISASYSAGTSTIDFNTTLGLPQPVFVQDGGQLTIGGAITDGTNTFLLQKTGGGTLTLSASNSYDGGTLVSGGFVEVTDGSALGTSSVFVGDLASLMLSNDISINNSMTLDGRTAGGFSKLVVGSGVYQIHGNIALTSNNQSFEVPSGGSLSIDSVISGSVDFDKNGAGQLVLSGTSTHTGRINVGNGSLFVDGDTSSSDLMFVDGILGGTGKVGALSISSIGTLAPGDLSPGILDTGDVSLVNDSIYSVELLGRTVDSEYDQLNVTGGVNLGTQHGFLTVSLGFRPTVGDVFTIINNDDTDGVIGYFLGLPEGTTFDIGNVTFRISYRAGTNDNDVTLTVANILDTWDGGGGDNNWTTAANWVGDIAPQGGDSLVFPVGAPRQTTTNDFDSGTWFDGITIADPNYVLGGNAIELDGDIAATYSAGVALINLNMELGSNVVIDVAAGGVLALNGVISEGPHSTVTKTNAGQLTLAGANTFGNGVNVNGGTLLISNGNALGSGNTVVDSGASLLLTNNITVSNSIDLRGVTAPGMSKVENVSGDNELQGLISLYFNNQSFDVPSGTTLTLSNAISGSVDWDKNGPGILSLTGTSTQTGNVNVGDGVLLVDGDISASHQVFVDGRLSGSGTVPTVIISNIGTLAPGSTLNSSSKILHTGDLSFMSSGSTYSVGIYSQGLGPADFDQTVVTGTVDLASATLNVSLNYTPTIGNEIPIIENEGSGAISNTFSGLPEGSLLTFGNVTMQISYVGGIGSNDVVLTVTDVTYTWDGGGTDDNWSTAANWVGDVVPTPGSNLVFPNGAARQTNFNDMIGRDYHSITIASAGYDLFGHPIVLDSGITTTYGSGSSRYDIDTYSMVDQTIDVAAGGTLKFDSQFSDDLLTAGLIKTGAGTLILSGGNSFDGGMTVSDGLLIVSNGLALGSANATISDEASLEVRDGITIPNGITFNGLATSGTVKLVSSGGDNVVQGDVSFNVNNNSIEVTAGSTLTLSGALSGHLDLGKEGAGTLILSGTSTYSGEMGVLVGTVLVNGSLADCRLIYDNSVLGGSGTVSTVVVSNVGTLTPGSALGNSPAILSTGNLTFNAGATYKVDLDGTTEGTGYDQANVTGSVVLNNATLVASLGFAATVGDTYTIIDNDDSDAVSGTFSGLSEGATFTVGNATMSISYTGGTNSNDVVLTVVDVTYTWDGGGGDNNWTTAQNWVSDLVPTPGSNLVFPAGAAQKSNANDFPIDTPFGDITIAANGYGLSGSRVALDGDLFYTGGAATVGQLYFDINLQHDTTVEVDPGTGLQIYGAISGGSHGLTLDGGGALVLGGNFSNTYTGTTTLNAGSLSLTKDSGAIAIAGDLTVNAGVTAYEYHDDQIADSSDVTLTGASLYLMNHNDTVGSLTLTGGYAQSGAGTLTIASGGFITTNADSQVSVIGGTLAFAGPNNTFTVAQGTTLGGRDLVVEAAVTSGMNIIKDGAGKMLLYGANSYSGGTNINSGILEIQNSAGAGTGVVNILGTGTLEVSGNITVNNPILITTTSAAIHSTGGVNTFGDNVTILADTTLNVDAGAYLAFSGTISDSSETHSLIKTGLGTLVLNGTNDYEGITTVVGTLVVNGSIATNQHVYVNGTLGGSGTVPAVSLASTATLAPGNSPGILNTRNLAFIIGATYSVEIDGSSVGTEYDQTNVTGTVDLDNATLSLSLGYTPTIGDTFTIIDNDDFDPITGTFNGLSEGSTLTIGNVTFTISYQGGTNNNDVVLTVTDVTFVWSGASPDDSFWTNPDNWVGGLVPTPGSNLIFPSNPDNTESVDNLASGMVFHSITVAGSNYDIYGNDIALANGLTTLYSSGTSRFELNTQLLANTAIDVASGGTLNFGGAISGAFSLSKTGQGTLDLTADNSYTGVTNVSAGKLLANAFITSSSHVYVDGTLGGLSAVPAVSISSTGTLSPGNSPAILNTGDLDFSNNSSYIVELDGTTAGDDYDQTKVTGTVDLTGAILDVSLGYSPTSGDSWTIIDNDDSDPVVGTFLGLPEGSTLAVDTYTFVITYVGGTEHNDVVLISNQAPTAVGLSSASVPENEPSGTVVGTFNTTDPDVGDTFAYTLVSGSGDDDNTSYTIDSTGQLLTAASFDRETKEFYSILVRSTDVGGLYVEQQFTITVLPVNDNAPVFTSSATFDVEENTSTVGTVAASDADLPAQTVTYSITGGTDKALFHIDSDSGALTFITSPDYELPGNANADNVYLVDVTADDGLGQTTVQHLSVTVTPVNDSFPIFTSATLFNVPENTTLVGTMSATDDDLPAQTLTYSLVPNPDSALFTIDPATGVLEFVSAPNYESPSDSDANNTYFLLISVADGISSLQNQFIEVIVTPVNEFAPAFSSSATFNVPENTTAVGTVSTTDADLPAQSVTYGLGGADAALFTINATSGVLAFITAPDYELPPGANSDNVYHVDVIANDNAGRTSTQNVTVTVTPMNDNAPIFTSLAAAIIPENSTIVETVHATDADFPAQSLIYSITGGLDSALFHIDSATGVLSFITAPDYEVPTDNGTNNSYFVDITASDNAGQSTVQHIAITVTPLNDNAPFFTSPGAFNVAENATSVGTVAATDADRPAQPITYSITGGADETLFTINPTTGVLTFNTAPNYESPADDLTDNVYHVDVTANDNSGLTTIQLIAVTVTPVNDNAPVFSSATSFTIAENTTIAGTVSATDADLPAQAMAYSITGGVDRTLFSINPNTGVLSFLTAPDYEHPADVGADNSYEVQVTANDEAGMSTAQDVTVNITNAVEDPVITLNPVDGSYYLDKENAYVDPTAQYQADVTETDYSVAVLTVSITANRQSKDVLGINPQGNRPGQISLKGKSVFFGGVVIGTFQGGSKSQPDLVITFNSSASEAAVQALVKRITFFAKNERRASHDPRTVQMQITNVSGHNSNAATRQINIDGTMARGR